MIASFHEGAVGHGPTKAAGITSHTLLVVDDSIFQCQAIARLLKGLKGLRVNFANNRRSALEALENEPPDLILTDLIMPDLDGLELVEQVRDRFPALPMILMTAYGGEDVAIRALRAGAANYIPKKDLTHDLVETVSGILRVSTLTRHRRKLLSQVDYRESQWHLGNDSNLITSLIELLQEELDGMNTLHHVEQIRVGVALQAALSNALYHGSLEVSSNLRQGDESKFYELAETRRWLEPYASRQIEVLVRIDRQAAVFTIGDEGPGFDTSGVTRPLEPEDLVRSGGRGLFLIRMFMDKVTFNATGNTITIVKRFG